MAATVSHGPLRDGGRQPSSPRRRSFGRRGRIGLELAFAHTAFWELMAGAFTEPLPCRFNEVPFACSYVPVIANVRLLWPVARGRPGADGVRLVDGATRVLAARELPAVGCRQRDADCLFRHRHRLSPAPSRPSRSDTRAPSGRLPCAESGPNRAPIRGT